MWDPDVYLAFADHRGRPFYDLLARVAAPAAEIVSKPERAPRVDPLAASLSPSAPPETEEDPFA